MTPAPLAWPARNRLLQAYGDWRARTHEEREGILAEDWAKVQRCQSQKAELQAEIIRLTPEAREETEADQGSLECHLRPLVEELIVLETHNGEMIAKARSRAQEQGEKMEKSRQNLRKIQRGYAPRLEANWQSFS